MHSLANSVDPDEITHNAAFNQGLDCFTVTKKTTKKQQQQYSAKELYFYVGIIT